MAVKKKDEIPFEQALQRLEEIVEQLEGGSVPLEQSVALFEEGIALRKRCLELLKRAEGRIKFLTRDAKGEAAETEPPEDWEDAQEEADDDVD